MVTRLQIAKDDIVRYFDSQETKVLRQADIAKVLQDQRGFWRLAQSTTTLALIDFLLKQGRLAKLEFPFPSRRETRYVWGDVPLLEVLLSLKAGSYFSHYTAVRLHGLTEQIPKTIYLNHEQPPRPQGTPLQQKAIDFAFRARPRVSNNQVDFESYRICLINGKATGQLGVETQSARYDDQPPATVRVTNLERTLIDIAVRPIYAGGVNEVAKAYSLAADRFSVNRLSAMLKKLQHSYPYHQAIGFYLEKSGVPELMLDIFRSFPQEFDFYLANQMGETDYVPGWRLFVPKGFNLSN